MIDSQPVQLGACLQPRDAAPLSTELFLRSAILVGYVAGNRKQTLSISTSVYHLFATKYRAAMIAKYEVWNKPFIKRLDCLPAIGLLGLKRRSEVKFAWTHMRS